MAGASDKARFYLEQYVPELQDYARHQIFTRSEIASITSKRSDFEHILNARNSTPADYARYATYEMNLDALRKKRCKRLGIKGTKRFSGQRTVFFILERGTKKFPGDLGLWMQYIHFCQREKANKKFAKVVTSVLRLKPREWGLWVLAAKWYAEELGDMSTARSYLQRGLRFCAGEKRLWVEYAKLEMVYLAKLAARRKILGLDGSKEEAGNGSEDENKITLPTITAADFAPDTTKGVEEVNESTLVRLANAPAYTGAIPVAIYDAALKHHPLIADDFFVLISDFASVPSSPKILDHILSTLPPQSPQTALCEARRKLFGIASTSPAFPAALGEALPYLSKAEPGKAAEMLLPYVEHPDEDVRTVACASLNRHLRLASSSKSKSKAVELLSREAQQGRLGPERMLEVWREEAGGARQ